MNHKMASMIRLSKFQWPKAPVQSKDGARIVNDDKQAMFVGCLSRRATIPLQLIVPIYVVQLSQHLRKVIEILLPLLRTSVESLD